MFTTQKATSVSISSIQSYIKSRDHESSSLDFIMELRRKLFCLHEYNCQILLETRKYPVSEQFYSILINYLEIECKALDQRLPCRNAELRILKLLRVMLYPLVHYKVPKRCFDTDIVLKRAILQLLQRVNNAYRKKQSLIWNLVQKLQREVLKENGTLLPQDKINSPTSDYGSDDNECDFDNKTLKYSFESNFFKSREGDSSVKEDAFPNSKDLKPETYNDPVIICSDSEDEKSDKQNKRKGVVVLEILDDDNEDDDTSYMMYIQKEVESKRSKKRKRRRKEISSTKETICLDSEEENETNNEGRIPSIGGPLIGGILDTENEDTEDLRLNDSFLIELLLDDELKNFQFECFPFIENLDKSFDFDDGEAES